jgi:hypothetical protein
LLMFVYLFIVAEKLYADSAFYDDHTASYPTIEEQMKLCKRIAQSLTAVINKKAKGARMFAQRKSKSNKWIHETGQGGYIYQQDASSTGDVANIHDLTTELDTTDGGTKPLFSFRIPNLASRVTEDTGEPKMSLTQDQFERLRLGRQKCDHRNVSPNTCFSLAADLQASKGKGGKMFAKRQERVNKYVIDETNAKKPVPNYSNNQAKLDQILGQTSQPPALSPWNAAMQNNSQPQQPFYPSSVGPPSSAPKHKLESDGQMKLIEGPNYNRSARGWGSSGGDTGGRGMYFRKVSL